ncbi:MAG: outer membrane beta-barrel protein [Chitinophagaceae bacterium]|nr:outer membrane beta-barrel protein [Chitinophagaceae bacterium]MBK7680183.1 outer membrane beta-barrel protein [Chitinophagaceae bacterium]MBK8301144.1 outer membrane beta-barrel protein [Chitinophagaceae bacterium]MBK9465432.1 outer membrane beta-barrel protein [Chitinophagaceae bacterium]MBK9660820.1 outer membrane beta-barrel protein [Chitinophagaceae bacterium]
MKRIFTLCAALCMMMAVSAQTDTTGTKNEPPAYDTIRIGGMIIVRKAGSKDKEVTKDGEYKMKNRRGNKPSNLTTNWWIFDLGFSSFNDESDYTSAALNGFVAPGINKDDFKLRTGKSKNVNVWFFMQKLNIAKHVLNLKYGLGLELNNYSFENTKLAFAKNPTFISEGADDFKKVKLAADYVTVPIMLNINFTPNRSKGFGISGGISAGYLYSARFKTKMNDDVTKIKSDFDLERFKLSYIGEIALGPVRLYGSYAMKNMWEKGLDMTPYNFGFRFSNW